MVESKYQLANDFAECFEGKIIQIHNQLSSQPGSTHISDPEPVPSCRLLVFEIITPEALYKIIKSAPTKSCPLDPIPSQIFSKYLLL